MSLRDDLLYMPDNELVFDYLDLVNERGPAEQVASNYPSLGSLMRYLSRMNATKLSPAEYRAYQQGMAQVANAIAHHAELETRTAETVV